MDAWNAHHQITALFVLLITSCLDYCVVIQDIFLDVLDANRMANVVNVIKVIIYLTANVIYVKHQFSAV